jgi:tetratricopeptide (TPR) repeat protein
MTTMPPRPSRAAAALLAALAFGPAPALASGLTPAVPQQTEGALEPLYQQGVAALQARRIDEAQRLFAQVLAQDPRHARAMIGLADVAIARNDRAGAERHLREAMAAQPNAPEPAIALATFLNATGQPEQAIALYRQVVARSPAAVGARIELAGLLARTGNRTEAEAQYRDAVRRAPLNAQARLGLVQLLMAEQRWPDAAEEATALANAIPADPRGPLLLGLAEAQRGDVPAALAAFDRANQADARFLPAHFARAELLLRRSEWSAAALAFQRVLDIEPANQAGMLGRGMALDRAGNSREAERLYRAVLQANAENWVAQNNLAFLLAEQRRGLEEAERLARSAVARAPNQAEPLSTLGWVMRGRGDLPQAAQNLEAASARPNAPAQVWVLLGRVYLEQGRRDAARGAADRALALEPQSTEAQELRRRAG